MRHLLKLNIKISILGFLLSIGIGKSGMLYAADKDDFYLELHSNLALNQKSRWMMGARLGYLFQNDLGLGAVYEQHSSPNVMTRDSSFNRVALEFRWFQEPFEFAGGLGLGKRIYRDRKASMILLPSASAAYLLALTHSLALMCDFSFYFLDEPRVIFSGGLGARLLF